MGLYFPDNSQIKNQLKISDKNNKKIAILGCGWLGLPLALYFYQKNFRVNGSTTTPEKLPVLKDQGINPYHIKLEPEVNTDEFHGFLDVNTLIINIPPSLRKKPSGHHIRQIQSICEKLDLPSKVIYISSTSVYVEEQKPINEEGAVNVSHELFQAEETLRQHLKNNLTILRCGGLMGYDRVPGKYFAGKTNLPGGNNPVNYVHRDDVINAIGNIVEKEISGEIFNVVSPYHPLKKEVCLKTANYFNLPLPQFKEEIAFGYKIVNSEKLVNTLKFKFEYPDPLNFFYKL